METFLLYILKSTLIITVLFWVFRLLMSNETCFSVNRGILIAIVIVALSIPLIYLPQSQNPVSVLLLPESYANQVQAENTRIENFSQVNPANTNDISRHSISSIAIIAFAYLSGALIALTILIKNVISVVFVLKKSTILRIDECRVVISNHDMPSFAFANTIIISVKDYEAHGSTILAHEKAHIQLKHFYDLIFLELVKVLYWFNPVVYGVIRNMKEIHEFQADAQTLNSGVDPMHYQLLLIEKCVGPQRFALANSFNQCQIKKRITMMNNSKNGKAWRWKVATFLPILVLLLMSFSKKRTETPEKASFTTSSKNELMGTASHFSQARNIAEIDYVIHIKKDGNYIQNKKCTLEEIVKAGKNWNNTSNQWIVLKQENIIDFKRVDEVREALLNAEVHFIVQSKSDVNELVYFAGDVTSTAKFKKGDWHSWFNSEVKKILGDKYNSTKYMVSYFFIIDEKGKAQEAHLVNPCEIQEINAAYEKVLSQIPDWYPAMQEGKPVNVYYREVRSQSFVQK